jgi:hypothetical protein
MNLYLLFLFQIIPILMNAQNKVEENTPGWDAIDKSLQRLYKDQIPQHYAPKVYYSLGGDEPLDGVSVFVDRKNSCYHYVTYGFSELYEKETDDKEVSGYGYELTFRLKYDQPTETYPVWPINLLQNIAKVVFEKGLVFSPYQTLSSGPIRIDPLTSITGILFILDPTLGEIKTPNGKVKFLQIVGLTSDEYEGIINKTIDRREFIKLQEVTNPLVITDVERKK